MSTQTEVKSESQWELRQLGDLSYCSSNACDKEHVPAVKALVGTWWRFGFLSKSNIGNEVSRICSELTVATNVGLKFPSGVPLTAMYLYIGYKDSKLVQQQRLRSSMAFQQQRLMLPVTPDSGTSFDRFVQNKWPLPFSTSATRLQSRCRHQDFFYALLGIFCGIILLYFCKIIQNICKTVKPKGVNPAMSWGIGWHAFPVLLLTLSGWANTKLQSNIVWRDSFILLLRALFIH